jgi:F-type H+-transporting ATPase subunit b
MSSPKHEAADHSTHDAHTATVAHTNDAAHDAHHDEGFWNAEAAVALAFFIVIGYLGPKVVKALGAFLDSRADKIRTSLDDARKAREDAQAMLADYERKQRNAMQEAEEIVVHAREEAKRIKEQGLIALDESLARREKQAMDRLAQAEAQAIREVKIMAADMAISAAENVIKSAMTKTQANTLVDQAIKDLPTQLH